MHLNMPDRSAAFFAIFSEIRGWLFEPAVMNFFSESLHPLQP